MIEKTFQMHIKHKFGVCLNKNTRGEILGWAGTYLCGYIMNQNPLLDCEVIPCVWLITGECLVNYEHLKEYDLIKTETKKDYLGIER